MIIQISETLLEPDEQFDTLDIVLRVWYTRSFIAGDGLTPIIGGNGKTGFYDVIDCSVTTGGQIRIPAFDVQATTESSPTAGFFGQLYVDNTARTIIFGGQAQVGWAIPTVYGPTITYDLLATYNRAKTLVYPPNTYFTADQTIQEILRLAGTQNYAGVGILGRTQLSVAPVDPVHPIAVGDNDPRLLTGAFTITPQQYGAVADGTSHPLSEFYGTLGEAQDAYDHAFYFVTSLSQEIDYVATKAASNACFGPDATFGAFTDLTAVSTNPLMTDTNTTFTSAVLGKTFRFRYANNFKEDRIIIAFTAHTVTLDSPVSFYPVDTPMQICGYLALGHPGDIFDCLAYAIGEGEHGFIQAGLNKALYFPGGTYVFGDDTWTVRNLVGGRIIGESRIATTLTSNSWVFQTDGLWYSTIEGITFQTLDATAGHGACDIDGNVPSHAYETRSVQQNTFKDCGFNGGESTYAFALNRQGGASAQGENIYINCNWIAATVCYYQNGFNALADLILRGDMQDFTTGVYLLAGQIQIIATSFESKRGYAQITDTSFVAQGGYDIDCSASGVTERIVITGVRSESLRFFRGSAVQPGILIGCNNACGSCQAWSGPGSNFTLNQTVVKNSVTQGSLLYRVTTAGASGAIEPIWPDSGTVADGSIVWSQTPFYVVDGGSPGTVTMIGNSLNNTGGSIKSSAVNVDYNVITITSSYSIPSHGNIPIPNLILVDATSADITLALPFFYGIFPNTVPVGTQVVVKRVDTTSHTVFVTASGGNHGTDGYDYPLLALGYLQVEMAIGLTGGSPEQYTWRIIAEGAKASSFNPTYSNAMTINVQIPYHVISVVSGTSATSTWTPSSAGSAGDWLYLETIADGSGTVTVTFASTFHPSGTQATTANRFSSVAFKSDGTRWIEQYRTTDLA